MARRTTLRNITSRKCTSSRKGRCKMFTKRRASSRTGRRMRGSGFGDNLTDFGNTILEKTAIGKIFFGKKYVDINPAQASLFHVSPGKLTDIGRQTETIRIIGVNFKTPTNSSDKNPKYLLKEITKPTNLNELILIRTNISKISKFPSVKYITCVGNQNLKELPELPANLININCMRNALIKLPNLLNSKNLVSLECQGNPITDFPEFPESLVYINAARIDGERYSTEALNSLIAFKNREPSVNVVMLDALNHGIAMSIVAGELEKNIEPPVQDNIMMEYDDLSVQEVEDVNDDDVTIVDATQDESDQPKDSVKNDICAEILVGEIEGSGIKAIDVQPFITMPKRELGKFTKRYIEVMELKNKKFNKPLAEIPVRLLVENDIHKNNPHLTNKGK